MHYQKIEESSSRKQHQEKIESIKAFRKLVDKSNKAKVKVLDDRENELKEEIKALAKK